MFDLNALGGFNFYTEGDVFDEIISVSHSVAFQGPRSHPISLAALVNFTRARIIPPMC